MINVKENEPLKNHSTFHIGGPAKYFSLVKDSAELMEAIEWAEEKSLPYQIIGGGSNILAGDKGYNGLIIKTLGVEAIFSGNLMECFAGLPLAKAMNDSLAKGYVGLEWAIGIPGTIGGATHNNAGAYGGEIADNVKSVKVLRQGKIIDILGVDCGFGYRASRFKTEGDGDVILSATLRLEKADTAKVALARKKMSRIIRERINKFVGFSAGSAFKNIILSKEEIRSFKNKYPEFPEQFVEFNKLPAAWLIDRCELKGFELGGAKVSDKHAGIIINTGKATAKDVIMLISIIKQKVRSKYGQQLMEEIEYIGF